ncbi:MAG TPA: response regulator [Pirellulales bacterium]|nr:response regulator [Pirellulales bacterium]
MPKLVLDVGQCNLDHGSIRRLVEGQFGARVVRAHQRDDALTALRNGNFDLVLVNRKLDADGDDGLAIIKAMKTDPQLSSMPVMLVTNFAEHQQKAIAAGAEPGFGKAQLDDPGTHEKLARFLREQA